MRKPFISNGVASDQKKIVFQVEPADRSVGIMSEGFSAWEENGTSWCNLDDIQPPKFTWYDNETGEACKPPVEHKVVEAALVGFANGYYKNEEEVLLGEDHFDPCTLCGEDISKPSPYGPHECWRK